MEYKELKNRVKGILQNNEDFRNEMKAIGLSNYTQMKADKLQEVLDKYGEYAREHSVSILSPSDFSFKKGFKMVIDGLTAMYELLDDDFLKKKSLK